MKKILLLIFTILTFSAFAQVSITPNPFNATESITITVDITSTSGCNSISNPTKVYMHSGIGDTANPWSYAVVGNWGQNDGVGAMTNNGNGTWSITITPKTYFNLSDAQAASASRIGMVFRNANGSQELKDTGCSDFYFNVGKFQVTLNTPEENSTTILSSGSNFSISATNTNGTANYTLSANDTVLKSSNAISAFSFTHSNITSNQFYTLTVVQGSETIRKTFSVIINPGTLSLEMPSGLENGINYNPADATKATLVLDAPLKDFVYVSGSFNNWQPTTNYAMKQDPNSGKFWLELTGLTPKVNETFQYWVVDQTPISDTPALVKTADPFSTLVLSPLDDPYIPETTYPNLPDYPAGQQFEVTVLQTGQEDYNWKISNFEKPKKEDLVIYEVLIRDFDHNRNYQDLIDRIDYFKNLNINAIELMPVMEFEGNESWGYNTSFHMALDKYYGTKNKLKEFIDLCHKNDIAVILDVALNHAFGRNPMVRMWMKDADGDGYGDPSSENPYFNETAKHSYNVGNDFNHLQARTQYYVNRVINHWITEFKIDGFRWDLTKGFTQNCSANDDSCTNNYQQDRVDILKQYADYSWNLDATHYVIFEHLGQDNEEQQWANYKIEEGKGIMLWGKMTDPYNQLTMGYSTNSNINRMGYKAHGYNDKRLIGYTESHDEERLMYKNLQYGAASGTYNVKDLTTALQRMEALGAISLTIPGPKMIWHFGDLGMENSIYTCNNGTINTAEGSDGDCKLDTKPQPQWDNNWLENASRKSIYDTWARINALKINEAVFEGEYSITSGNLTPKIHIWDTNITDTELNNVIIIANFSTSNTTVNPEFPNSGIWYDLMDASGNTSIQASSAISLAPGTFRIYGNTQAKSLSIPQLNSITPFALFPNPTTNQFQINKAVSQLCIYDITGKLMKTFSGKFTKDHLFDISSLPSSMYLVTITNNSGITQTTKLVKY